MKTRDGLEVLNFFGEANTVEGRQIIQANLNKYIYVKRGSTIILNPTEMTQQELKTIKPIKAASLLKRFYRQENVYVDKDDYNIEYTLAQYLDQNNKGQIIKMTRSAKESSLQKHDTKEKMAVVIKGTTQKAEIDYKQYQSLTDSDKNKYEVMRNQDLYNLRYINKKRKLVEDDSNVEEKRTTKRPRTVERRELETELQELVGPVSNTSTSSSSTTSTSTQTTSSIHFGSGTSNSSNNNSSSLTNSNTATPHFFVAPINQARGTTPSKKTMPIIPIATRPGTQLFVGSVSNTNTVSSSTTVTTPTTSLNHFGSSASNTSNNNSSSSSTNSNTAAPLFFGTPINPPAIRQLVTNEDAKAFLDCMSEGLKQDQSPSSSHVGRKTRNNPRS